MFPMFPMLKTLMSSLFKKSATVLYPVEKREFPNISRGTISITIEDCIYCGMCQRKCPTGAIEVSRNDKLWSINRFDCIQCCSCVENCPKKCLHMTNTRPKPGYEISKELVEGARVQVSETDNTNS